MAIHNKNIIVDNLLLRYYYFSPKGAKKTLLFLHGWGVDSLSFGKLVDRLTTKKYAVYLLDLPGFGQSQMPETVYNVDDYSNAVSQFVKKMGLKDLILIGHSFGGRIAIKIAAENPGYLDKAVLVDTAGIATASTMKRILSVLAKIVSPIFKPDFMQPLRKRFYFLIGSEYLENEKLSMIFSKVVSENLTRTVAQIRIPTLIVWGENDSVTPIYFGRLMNKLIPKSKLIIFSNAGHFPFIDNPNKFIEALTEFI
jgi:pimeloyl-ACP methyl ester carboxylesterase